MTLADIAYLMTPCNKKCSKEADFIEASYYALPTHTIVLVGMTRECLT